MNESDGGLSCDVIRIETATSYAIVTPIRLVSRADISLEAFTLIHFFGSKNSHLCSSLHEDAVLLAHFQDADFRSKRLVCIEALSTGLFSISQCNTSHFSSTQIPIYHKSGTIPPPNLELIDFDNETSWRTLIHVPKSSRSSISGKSEIVKIDLGLQPACGTVEDATTLQASFEDILSTLHPLYLQTLYTSRASLAYFAKSILPKIKSRLEIHQYDLRHYAAYLQSRVIPCLTALDAKYKFDIPQMVRSHWGSEGAAQESKLSQLVEEQDFICSWISLNTAGTKDAEDFLAKHCQSVKFREYQLTVLLLLESFAILESTQGRVSPSSLPPSNPQEPMLVLDILLDRLGIIQSLDFVRNEDRLREFCLEVVTPFYLTRLPHITQSIVEKCVSTEFLAPEIPPTPAKDASVPPRMKKQGRDAARTAVLSNSATLKRTRSAPANLLTNGGRPYSKKPNLGREISMSKRAPSLEKRASKPQVIKALSFEERRRHKIQKEEQERVQVGQTPAKVRHNAISHNNATAVSQLAIPQNSKANFMAIGETPSKQPNILGYDGISETPGVPMQTPLRTQGRITQAPADGIQDTPSGKSILFKLKSPSILPLRQQELYDRRENLHDFSLLSSPEDSQPRAALPRLKKSVTFSGSGFGRSRSGNLFGAFLDQRTGDYQPGSPTELFGESIVVAKGKDLRQSDIVSSDSEAPEHLAFKGRNSEGEHQDSPRKSPDLDRHQEHQETLEDALDWL